GGGFPRPCRLRPAIRAPAARNPPRGTGPPTDPTRLRAATGRERTQHDHLLGSSLLPLHPRWRAPLRAAGTNNRFYPFSPYLYKLPPFPPGGPPPRGLRQNDCLWPARISRG